MRYAISFSALSLKKISLKRSALTAIAVSLKVTRVQALTDINLKRFCSIATKSFNFHFEIN